METKNKMVYEEPKSTVVALETEKGLLLVGSQTSIKSYDDDDIIEEGEQ